ncbi:hypothetical protein GWI33_019448 [Rhynchophorus ferrugineus]|uniref:Hexosyltransferase n=1 Tax=Rhynchophorus ferrugineus TaxID=354439 RepID=A0A834M5B5_RHYFE|nr:hypothetical protein GWI33_019448 [Rhynchophorus ferrugineus]
MYLSVHEFVAGVKEPVEINLNPLLNSSSQKLLNIPFRYVLNNELLCANTNGDILAVIIVTSYLANVETRNSMRRAFSATDLMSFRVRRVFLLGVAPTDKYIKQSAIESESQTFGDIVQGNFTEAYRNLTYKHIMGLKWATRFCSNKICYLFVTLIISGWFYITNYVSAKNIESLQCCLQDFDKNIICDISVGPNGGNCMKRVKLINETCVAERKFNLGRGIGQIRSFKLK